MCLYFLPTGSDKDYMEKDMAGAVIKIMRNNTCESSPVPDMESTSLLPSLWHIKHTYLNAHATPDNPLLCEPRLHKPRFWQLIIGGGSGH